MLLFDESKTLEKHIGEEATRMLARIFERYDEEARKNLATKGDLLEMELRLRAEIYKARAETIKWTVGLVLAQTAVLATLIKF